MLLQPQALAQHLLHGLAHGVVVAAGDGLDFGPGVAQSRLQAVGGVEQLGKRTLALAATAARSEEHTPELPSLIRISYAVFCLNKKNNTTRIQSTQTPQQQ